MEGESQWQLQVSEGLLKWQLTSCANDCNEDGKMIKGYKKLGIMEEATEFSRSQNNVCLHGWSEQGKVSVALPASVKLIPCGFVSATGRDQ